MEVVFCLKSKRKFFALQHFENLVALGRVGAFPVFFDGAVGNFVGFGFAFFADVEFGEFCGSLGGNREIRVIGDEFFQRAFVGFVQRFCFGFVLNVAVCASVTRERGAGEGGFVRIIGVKAREVLKNLHRADGVLAHGNAARIIVQKFFGFRKKRSRFRDFQNVLVTGFVREKFNGICGDEIVKRRVFRFGRVKNGENAELVGF